MTHEVQLFLAYVSGVIAGFAIGVRHSRGLLEQAIAHYKLSTKQLGDGRALLAQAKRLDIETRRRLEL